MDEQQQVPVVNTPCHECGGSGLVARTYMALVDGELGTLMGPPRRCPSCKGARWLPGMVIPV